MRARHCVGVLGLSVALSGCVTSTEIKSDTMSFDDVIEDTTNKLLLLNVLRARDKAPLHFADIPVIRESLQESLSLGGTRVYGPVPGTTLRNTTFLNGFVQKSPSFEVNHLDSKDFATGISSPIDVKFVKYWLDRGLDRRIILLLFFSAVEIVETRSETGPINTIRVENSPRDAVDVIGGRKRPFTGPETVKCDSQSDFERYLKLINMLKTFFAHSYRERRVLATGLSLDAVKDNRGLPAFAALDQTRIQLSYDKGLSAYNLYALSPDQKVAFCFYENRRPERADAPYAFVNTGAATLKDKRSCSQSVVDIPPEDSTRAGIAEYPIFFPGAGEAKKPSDYCAIYNRFVGVDPARTDGYPKLELKLHIRSVGEIFQFLGDLLHYQDEVKRFARGGSAAPARLNSPVTFGYCPDDSGAGCDDVFFRLDGDPETARFSLLYRDKVYSVANVNPPEGSPCTGSRCPEVSAKDHTLEILSVVHQLVDLNKSASDIRATPFVQVLP